MGGKMSNKDIATNERSQEIKQILTEVYDAMCERGYNPTKQIAGYILSEDPVYITDWNNARGKIARINRDELLDELISNYLDIK